MISPTTTCASTPSTEPDRFEPRDSQGGCPGFTIDAMDIVHVVAGVVVNDDQEILLARRPAHAHQGGLWEFPGGKVEHNETPLLALCRELHEEVGIDVVRARPFIQVEHSYPDKRVLLDVHRVLAYGGRAHGREGQPIRWVNRADISGYEFPAANLPIVTAVRLPEQYLITGVYSGPADFRLRLERALDAGVRLIQLRAKALPETELCRLAREALSLCHARGATLLVNAGTEVVTASGADGLHLSSRQLMQCTARPLPRDAWVGASVHNAHELEHAHAIGVDFVVIAPVLPTTSHPGATTLGWDGFAKLARRARVPAYALGGLGPAALNTTFEHGGQGIAAISALWDQATGTGA